MVTAQLIVGHSWGPFSYKSRWSRDEKDTLVRSGVILLRVEAGAIPSMLY